MLTRLQWCATYLKEVEEKLLALQESLEIKPEQKTKVAEALIFVQQARNAVSETTIRITSLQKPLKQTNSD